MPRIGEFCAANVTRFLLSIFIFVGAIVAVGFYCFYSAGKNDPTIKSVTTSSPRQ